jgi:ADP-ribose pyrophosphatase
VSVSDPRSFEGDGRHVLMVRQYRAPLDRYVLEVPAGKRDVFDEPPEQTARRELAEEVGRNAKVWSELGRFWNSPGFTDEETICYLAEDLTIVERVAQGIEEDHMSVERVALVEFWDLLSLGVLVDAKSIIALALAERVLSQRGIAS